MSPDVTPMFEDYFKHGWNRRDVRAQFGVPIILRKGVTADHEFISPERIRKSPYYQDWGRAPWLPLFCGGRIHCRAKFLVRIDSAYDPARSLRAGRTRPPRHAVPAPERCGVGCRGVSASLTALGICNGLELVSQAAMLFDDVGGLLTLNESAERLVGDMVDPRTRTLTFRDPSSRSNFDRLLSEVLNPQLQPGPVRRTVALLDKARTVALGSGGCSARLGAGSAFWELACCSSSNGRER